MLSIATVLTAFSVSSTVCLGLVLLAPALLDRILREDLLARQASHVQPTLRLGGLGIFAGICVAAPYFAPERGLLLLLLASSLPVFISGLLEDIGFAQSPRMRLGMAAVSSMIVILITGVYVQHVGIVGFDALLAFFPFAAAFTIFATVGLIHAFNLVDGMNGLAGTVALVGVLGLTAIASRAGIDTMDAPVLALVGSIFGFLALNYPAGRIFLGDAGAYSLGFVLAWLAVSVMSAAPDISPWSILLIFFWPVADTMLAIWRRHHKRAPISQPDRLHSHQVIMRVVEILVLRRKVRRLSNPLTTLIVIPFMLPPALAGVLFWDSNLVAAGTFLGFSVLFVVSYLCAVRGAQRLRSKTGLLVARWNSHARPDSQLTVLIPTEIETK